MNKCGKFNGNWRGGINQIDVVCFWCGSGFKKPKRLVEKAKRVFCSRECCDDFQRKNALESGLSVEKECKVCGKKFRIPKTYEFRFSTCGKDCYAQAKKKEMNGNWKGGITQKHKADLTTVRYRKWRKAVFERDSYTCQGCGKRGGNLAADHIKSWAHNPDLRYEIDNGRTLCVKCHKMTYYYNIKRKLSDEQAVEIVKRRRSGERLLILAKEFGVSIHMILRISKYKTYKHATSYLFGEYFPKTSDERIEMENMK